jgi:hypothetical protein
VFHGVWEPKQGIQMPSTPEKSMGLTWVAVSLPSPAWAI